MQARDREDHGAECYQNTLYMYEKTYYCVKLTYANLIFFLVQVKVILLWGMEQRGPGPGVG